MLEKLIVCVRLQPVAYNDAIIKMVVFMVKWLIMVIIVAVFSLGCTQEPVTPEPTNPAYSGPTDNITEPTDEIAERPSQPIGDPFPWEVPQWESVSYETLFSGEITYAESTGLGWQSWAVQRSSGTLSYYELKTDEDGFYICAYGSETVLYRVPGSEKTPVSNLYITDGRWMYFVLNNQSIYRTELETGVTEMLFAADQVLQGMHLCNHDVLYFAALTGETIDICRLYLPGMKLDVLFAVEAKDTSLAWFQLQRPESSNGSIVWTMMNPEFYPLLLDAVNNPDSAYRQTDWGTAMPRLWSEGSIENLAYEKGMLRLCWAIQDDNSIRPLLKGIYDWKNNIYIEQFGVIDNCYFGTGLDHDHYA